MLLCLSFQLETGAYESMYQYKQTFFGFQTFLKYFSVFFQGAEFTHGNDNYYQSCVSVAMKTSNQIRDIFWAHRRILSGRYSLPIT